MSGKRFSEYSEYSEFSEDSEDSEDPDFSFPFSVFTFPFSPPSREGLGEGTPLIHPRVCPLPLITYLLVVISSRAMGPRAWSFCVELPSSAPRPNCAPSVKEVGALW